MMWPRKQLDIGWIDLAFGLAQATVSRKRPEAADVIGTGWLPADEAVIALSVRTGWDLLLAALELPAGSEVITSAVTIPDMVRIIEEHGLVPMPVDIDAATLEVDTDQLERLITPRTRAILVAHLFGSRMEMGPIIEVARRHDLLVVEDCAQAFVGREYAGHADSDCALFSFGPIKTATALGGAVLRVRNDAVRARMTELQQAYPVQSRWTYLKRLAKYAGFCVLSRPRVYGLAVWIHQRMGVDYDQALGNAAHSFGASEFFTQIRRQPCVPLVRMLARRLATFQRRGEARLRRRAARGHELAHTLPEGMVVGDQNLTHTFWVMPVRVGNRAAVITALRAAGFDATELSSLIVVPAGHEIPASELPPATWLKEMVFLPSGDDLPGSEWQRQVAILEDRAETVEPRAGCELAELTGIASAP
jgi:dTDP-4-amino-4,6-dideoxygalactose transaminase